MQKMIANTYFLKAMDERNLTRDYRVNMAIKYENLSCKKQNLSPYKKEINIYKISTLCGFYPFLHFVLYKFLSI